MTTQINVLNPFKGMLTAAISEATVSEMQERARFAGMKAVLAELDGIGVGLTTSYTAVVHRVVPLCMDKNYPEFGPASLSCLAEAFYAVDSEIRRRNLVCADNTRVAVLTDSIAFGVFADPTVVASVFHWSTHTVSNIVPFEVADAAEDAWGEAYIEDGVAVWDWLERWANTPGINGIRPRFLPTDVIIQQATAALHRKKSARA